MTFPSVEEGRSGRARKAPAATRRYNAERCYAVHSWQYEADLANPVAVFADQTRGDTYLWMYGNICHDMRDRYVNFPWSSEVR
jgi:hypothetical protein